MDDDGCAEVGLCASNLENPTTGTLSNEGEIKTLTTKGKALTDEEKMEKCTILKNVVTLSVAFLILFTSYNSMENMQSSLNNENGTTSLAALYIGFLISGCFLPSLMMEFLQEKYTLVLCSFCFTFYMACQFYPKIYFLIPTAVFLGLAAAGLWSAKGTYITKSGERYAKLTGQETSTVITRFFSIFFMFYQSTQVFGNFISSSVLSVGVDAELNKSEESLKLCGYQFCIGDKNSVKDREYNISSMDESMNIPKADAWQIYVLSTIYVAGPVLASLVIFIFLDPIKRQENGESVSLSQRKTSFQLLTATFSHLRHPYQLLLIPLTIWSGVERAFLGADYTAAYVSCGLGIHMVGYVMICYGVCAAIASISVSTIVNTIGRVPVMTFAFLINVSVIVTLIYWMPNQEDMIWFFVISGLWGIADAIWLTQINSLYGLLFTGNSEAAFSNCRLWEATGFTIAFACSSVLCISSKIFVILSFLVFGVAGYFTIEVMEKMGRVSKNEV